MKFSSSLLRILSIACGPSASTFAFAAAASSSSHPHSYGGSHLTSSLTSPGLPSSRVTTNEMAQFTRSGMMSKTGTSSYRRGELPTAGGVFIWDLKTQRQKVGQFVAWLGDPLSSRQIVPRAFILFLSLSLPPSIYQCSLPLKPLSVGVHCMAFNHNSNLLITGGADGMIRLFGK